MTTETPETDTYGYEFTLNYDGLDPDTKQHCFTHKYKLYPLNVSNWHKFITTSTYLDKERKLYKERKICTAPNTAEAEKYVNTRIAFMQRVITIQQRRIQQETNEIPYISRTNIYDGLNRMHQYI